MQAVKLMRRFKMYQVAYHSFFVVANVENDLLIDQ